MSLGILFTLLLLLVVFAIFGGIIFSTHFLEAQLTGLLPPTLYQQTSLAIHYLLLEQGLGLLIVGMAALILLLFILNSLVTTPLRQIIKAMVVFTKTGKHSPLPHFTFAPNEIHTLAKVFNEFVVTVEQTHQRDEALHLKDANISNVKSDFISTAAHQFRTPLTGIRWSLEALEKEPLTDDQMALVKSAKDKSHDLVSIVGTLLDISSIESGKYKYDFQSTNIDQIVEQVTKDFEPMAQKSQVSLVYEKSGTKLPNVRADKERIKWVLNNLIENAIRYTPADGHITITAEVNSGRLYVRVRDTGIGIDEKDKGNIFERFYRAGNAISKENQGNGLGLYIAKTIATDHGGDLTFIANGDEPGTTFILSLLV